MRISNDFSLAQASQNIQTCKCCFFTIQKPSLRMNRLAMEPPQHLKNGNMKRNIYSYVFCYRAANHAVAIKQMHRLEYFKFISSIYKEVGHNTAHFETRLQNHTSLEIMISD